MEQRQIPLSDEMVEQLNKYDESITHWSTEIVRLDLQRKAMFDNVDGIYQGRQTMLDKLITESGVDPSQIMQMKPVKKDDGKFELVVLIRPKNTQSATPGSGGVPTNPFTGQAAAVAAAVKNRSNTPNNGSIDSINQK